MCKVAWIVFLSSPSFFIRISIEWPKADWLTWIETGALSSVLFFFVLSILICWLRLPLPYSLHLSASFLLISHFLLKSFSQTQLDFNSPGLASSIQSVIQSQSVSPFCFCVSAPFPAFPIPVPLFSSGLLRLLFLSCSSNSVTNFSLFQSFFDS